MIEVKLFTENSHCVVSVKDNGHGIPEDKVPKIFTPNFTTKTGGTGLGLAISKDFIEAQGGKIWVESEIGQGSNFSFSLPIQA
jgi:signal transduction histidine kinase